MLLRIALLLFSLTVFQVPALAAETAVVPAPESPLTSEQASVPAFRRDGASVMSAAKTASVFIAVLAVAAIGVAHFFRRGSVRDDANRKINVLDKQVVTPGLLAILIEADNQKILVLQDKKSHSAIRLNNEDKQ